LDKLIGELGPELKQKYMLEIALGIQYLHDRKIAHRDIKPENIFVHQQTIKVGDFGFAKTL
jgi:serine/threonine protein kinase